MAVWDSEALKMLNRTLAERMVPRRLAASDISKAPKGMPYVQMGEYYYPASRLQKVYEKATVPPEFASTNPRMELIDRGGVITQTANNATANDIREVYGQYIPHMQENPGLRVMHTEGENTPTSRFYQELGFQPTYSSQNTPMLVRDNRRTYGAPAMAQSLYEAGDAGRLSKATFEQLHPDYQPPSVYVNQQSLSEYNQMKAEYQRQLELDRQMKEMFTPQPQNLHWSQLI